MSERNQKRDQKKKSGGSKIILLPSLLDVSSHGTLLMLHNGHKILPHCENPQGLNSMQWKEHAFAELLPLMFGVKSLRFVPWDNTEIEMRFSGPHNDHGKIMYVVRRVIPGSLSVRSGSDKLFYRVKRWGDVPVLATGIRPILEQHALYDGYHPPGKDTRHRVQVSRRG